MKLPLLSQSHNWWQRGENCLLNGREEFNPYFTLSLLKLPTSSLNQLDEKRVFSALQAAGP